MSLNELICCSSSTNVGLKVLAAILTTLLLITVYNNFYTQEIQETTTSNIVNSAPAYAPPTQEVETNPIPPDSVLGEMTSLEILDFFYPYVFSPQVLCNRVLRMGLLRDGGWDLCDDPKYKPDKTNCLVYSMGINNEWSFDDDMEKYNCEVHSYDPSMVKVENHVRNKKIHFQKVGIGGKDFTDKRGWPMLTLGSMRRKNGHEPEKRRVDVVKMDVEGSEFEALPAAIKEGSLRDVRQLSFEIHARPSKNYLRKFLNIMRDLWDQGFRIYYTTRNTVGNNVRFIEEEKRWRTACTEVNMVNIRHRR